VVLVTGWYEYTYKPGGVRWGDAQRLRGRLASHEEFVMSKFVNVRLSPPTYKMMPFWSSDDVVADASSDSPPVTVGRIANGTLEYVIVTADGSTACRSSLTISSETAEDQGVAGNIGDLLFDI